MYDTAAIKDNKTIIVGITNTGDKFRPGNWAERIAGLLSTFDGHRIRYSPLLIPDVTEDGYPCVILDARLETENPALHDYTLCFARENHLTILKAEPN